MTIPAAAAPSAGQPRGEAAAAPAWRRTWVLVAGVSTVWALLLAAAISPRPLFLWRPPITRRQSGFFSFKGQGCSHALSQGSWTDEFLTVRVVLCRTAWLPLSALLRPSRSPESCASISQVPGLAPCTASVSAVFVATKRLDPPLGPCSCINPTQHEFATCADTPRRHWRFSGEAVDCGARRRGPAEARAALEGQRLVFAGDSIVRSLYAATLRLLGDPGQSIVVGHANFQHQLEGGISMQFFWAPYPSNITDLLQRQLAPVEAAAGELRLEMEVEDSSTDDGGDDDGEKEEDEKEEEEKESHATVADDDREAEEGEEAAGTVGTSSEDFDSTALEESEEEYDQEEDQKEGYYDDGDDDEEEEEYADDEEEEEEIGDGVDDEERAGKEDSAAANKQDDEGDVKQQDGRGSRQRLLRRVKVGVPKAAAAAPITGAANGQQQAPSLVVLSTTLWHLLHMTAADDFAAELRQLKAAAAAYQAGVAAAVGGIGAASKSGASSVPQLLLASSIETFPNRMRTAEKQHSMTPANVDAYNQAMDKAGLLSPAGPFRLFDLFPLTQHCGEECSVDGVHSEPEVYDAALQLLLNIAAAEHATAEQRQQHEAPRPKRRRLRRALLDLVRPGR